MTSHGIWHHIDTDAYRTNKSHGAQNHWADYIHVGTSATNSHEFARVSTSRIVGSDGLWHVRLFVDGECVKHHTYNGKWERVK